MEIILYTNDSTITVTNVVRYEIKNEEQTETVVVPKKKRTRKKKETSTDQISMDSLMTKEVVPEPIKEPEPEQPQPEPIPEPDTSRTIWLPDAERVWEYEWPASGCYPLRRRKIQSVLSDNTMIKADSI